MNKKNEYFASNNEHKLADKTEEGDVFIEDMKKNEQNYRLH